MKDRMDRLGTPQDALDETLANVAAAVSAAIGMLGAISNYQNSSIECLTANAVIAIFAEIALKILVSHRAKMKATATAENEREVSDEEENALRSMLRKAGIVLPELGVSALLVESLKALASLVAKVGWQQSEEEKGNYTTEENKLVDDALSNITGLPDDEQDWEALASGNHTLKVEYKSVGSLLQVRYKFQVKAKPVQYAALITEEIYSVRKSREKN